MKRFKNRMKPEAETLQAGWNVGGTLHNVTVSQWHQGTWADGLATCSDWVVAIQQLDGKQTPTGGTFRITLDTSDPDWLLFRSRELQQAVTVGTRKQLPHIGHQNISQYAMTAASALGWLNVEED